MAGISSKALAFGNPNNRKGYVGNEIQNKEFIDGSGLDFYDFNARTYDQQIGRFIQIDPLSEEADQEGWSPFHYSYDNPVTYSDPDGKCPCLIIPVVQAITAAVVAGTTTYVVVKSYENSDLDLNLSLPAATGTGTARPAMAGSAAQLDFAVERQLAKAQKQVAKESGAPETAQAAARTGGAGRALAKLGSEANPHSTSRAARRDAMRKEGIPTSQQPSKQKNTKAGKVYEYEVPTTGGGKGTKQVQQQTKDKDHKPHWEAGTTKPGGQKDNIGRDRLKNDKSKSFYNE